jgi:phosphatidylglycerophosphate synthase
VPNEAQTQTQLNAPNALSAFRVLCVPLLLALAWNGATGIFLILFAPALLSDVLDGVLARKLGQESEFGARLDQWSAKLSANSAKGGFDTAPGSLTIQS